MWRGDNAMNFIHLCILIVEHGPTGDRHVCGKDGRLDPVVAGPSDHSERCKVLCVVGGVVDQCLGALDPNDHLTIRGPTVILCGARGEFERAMCKHIELFLVDRKKCIQRRSVIRDIAGTTIEKLGDINRSKSTRDVV